MNREFATRGAAKLEQVLALILILNTRRLDRAAMTDRPPDWARNSLDCTVQPSNDGRQD